MDEPGKRDRKPEDGHDLRLQEFDIIWAVVRIIELRIDLERLRRHDWLPTHGTHDLRDSAVFVGLVQPKSVVGRHEESRMSTYSYYIILVGPR